MEKIEHLYEGQNITDNSRKLSIDMGGKNWRKLSIYMGKKN